MRSRLVRLVILVLSLVFSGLISASPVENGAVTTSYDQAPTAKTVSPRMPITVVDTANLTDVTNPTQIANLSKRLDPTAHHLLIGECQKMARHRPMCCRHGYGSHHHECRLGALSPNHSVSRCLLGHISNSPIVLRAGKFPKRAR